MEKEEKIDNDSDIQWGTKSHWLPYLYCERPILRVGMWPIWVGPDHSALQHLTLHTSSLTYPKMSNFCQVVLKWQAFSFSNLANSTKIEYNWAIFNSNSNQK